MFVPRPYREPDGSWMVELIRANPLGLLATNGGDDGPFATHLPVIPDPHRVGHFPIEKARQIAQQAGHGDKGNREE